MTQYIVAKQTTWLYKERKFREGGSEKCGTTWGVDKVLESSDGGKWLKLKLSSNSGIWYVLSEHWELKKVSRPNDSGIGPVSPDTGRHRVNGESHVAANETPLQGKSRGIGAVPYFSQRDNQNPGTCFSSSVAMVIAAADPALIKDDADYIKVRQRYGKSTDAASHLRALKDFGLVGEFSQNRTIEWLRARASHGKVTALGILHNGPLSYPRRDHGHWVVCWGYKDGLYKIMDPAGLLDYLNGGYIGDDGSDVRWPEEVLVKRWTAEAERGFSKSGWSLHICRQ